MSMRSGRVAGALMLAAAGLLAAGALVTSKAVRDLAAPEPTPARQRVDAAVQWRADAAVWVVKQVHSTVGCDPAMCAELVGHGMSDGLLLPLRTSEDEVLNADVVVVTAAVRSMFGAGLTPITSPDVLCRKGTGPGMVEVLQVTPEGVAAYRKQHKADARALRQAGRELLGRPNLGASRDAAAQLAAGQVDGRLLSGLAAVASSYHVYVRAFTDGGADQGVPLRGAELSGKYGDLKSIRRFFDAQESRFRPILATLDTESAGTVTILRIRYAAPSPSGSLDS
ncbi:hypothetical protein J5X84_36570 [Streptosporangiaceae bacterium NEAU-GS5]|nr:hypothetical protein [Streptosporangiaceae bacterium NEAU-GS5]